MPVRHAVPLAPSVSLRLHHLPCRTRNEQSCFHSPYTLPSSVSRKSFACHSCENTRSVGVFFPFRNPLVGCRGYDPDDERLSKLSTNSFPPRITDRLPLTCPNPVGVTTTPASTPLDATLMDLLASVASKRLTVRVKSFRCNIYKKPGVAHRPPRCTDCGTPVTSDQSLPTPASQCYHSGGNLEVTTYE
jgi:hypothetical protein